MLSSIRSERSRMAFEVFATRVFRNFISMTADEFCDRWFGLDKLSLEEKEQVKGERGYQARCARLLATILKKPEKTVKNWGTRFENMPADYEVTLAFADAIRLQLVDTPETLLRLFVEQNLLNEN